MTLDEILRHFEKPRKAGRGFLVRCPGHEDKKNSLSIGEENERILIKCHAGCETESILNAAGLKLSDLFINNNGQGKSNDPVIQRYVYNDENGNPLFRVCRTASKKFFQERFEGILFIPGVNGVRRVPYNLPELIKAKAVLVVEGEKDVETLRAIGLVATTNAGGAGKWDDGFRSFFKDKDVTVLPDNDEPGRQHADNVIRSIRATARAIKMVSLPVPDKGDVSDYLKTHNKEELLALINTAKVDSNQAEEELSLVTMDQIEAEKIDWLWQGRIPLCRLTTIDGDPGVGKSWLTLAVAAAISTGSALPGGYKSAAANVLLLSCEDGLADTVRPRLDSLGANNLRIVVPDPNKNTVTSLLDGAFLEKAVKTIGPKLIIIDPIIAFSGKNDPDKAVQVRELLTPLQDIARRYYLAIIIVRHFTKQQDRRALHRAGGSVDWTAIVRSGFIVIESDEEPGMRILSPYKTTDGKMAPSLSFYIDENGFRWGREIVEGADELLAASCNQGQRRERAKLNAAAELLKQELARGPVSSNDIMDKGEKAGISRRTIFDAKDKLGVKASKAGMFGGWMWRLDEECNRDSSKSAT